MSKPQCPETYPSIGLVGWTLHMKDYIDRKVKHRLDAGGNKALIRENGLEPETKKGAAAVVWFDAETSQYHFDRYLHGAFVESGSRPALEAVVERMMRRPFQGFSTS